MRGICDSKFTLSPAGGQGICGRTRQLYRAEIAAGYLTTQGARVGPASAPLKYPPFQAPTEGIVA